MGGASVMVEIYSNRVEISNPGEPVVPVERFIDGYQSRNERLADLMRRMGICEEKSSGIDRVVHAAEVYPVARAGFPRGPPPHRGDNLRTQGFRGNGSGRPHPGLLPALRVEVGHVGADDQSIFARAVSLAGEQECHRFAGDRRDHRGGSDQAG